MKKRRVNWPHGNPEFRAWEFETPDGRIVVRRNRPVVRRGARLCQGGDIWLDGKFVVTLGSRPFSELRDLSRAELPRAARPACCGCLRCFLPAESEKPSGKGGARPKAGRKAVSCLLDAYKKHQKYVPGIANTEFEIGILEIEYDDTLLRSISKLTGLQFPNKSQKGRKHRTTEAMVIIQDVEKWQQTHPLKKP